MPVNKPMVMALGTCALLWFGVSVLGAMAAATETKKRRRRWTETLQDATADLVRGPHGCVHKRDVVAIQTWPKNCFYIGLGGDPDHVHVVAIMRCGGDGNTTKHVTLADSVTRDDAELVVHLTTVQLARTNMNTTITTSIPPTVHSMNHLPSGV